MLYCVSKVVFVNDLVQSGQIITKGGIEIAYENDGVALLDKSG